MSGVSRVFGGDSVEMEEEVPNKDSPKDTGEHKDCGVR